jgi:hypothetical protein
LTVVASDFGTTGSALTVVGLGVVVVAGLGVVVVVVAGLGVVVVVVAGLGVVGVVPLVAGLGVEGVVPEVVPLDTGLAVGVAGLLRGGFETVD